MAVEELTIYNRLIGAREAAAGFNAEAAAAARLAGSLELAGRETDRLRRRSWLMNQALFTARRYVYAGTLALTAMAGAAVYMGLKFDSTMEQSRVSMTHFLGSVSAANKELDYLYQLAAVTPFEFPQLADAARKFLAYGYSLSETNKYLKIIGDTAAGLGAGADVIQRLVLVFGQMRASGRVLGNDMLQLQQIGINVYGALRNQLGLTTDQIRKLQQGNLLIPSELAIPAIMAEMDRIFHGSAEKQSKTLLGMLTTLHDYVAQTLGVLTLPLVNRLEKSVIPRLIRLSQSMSAAGRSGQGITGIMRAMNQELSPNTGFIIRAWTRISEVFQVLVNTIKLLWPGVRDAVMIFLAFVYIVSGPVLQVLNGLAKHMTLLRFIVMYLTLRFLFLNTAIGVARLVGWLYGLRLIWLAKTIREVAIIQNLLLYKSMITMRIAALRTSLALFLFRLNVIRTSISIRGLRATVLLMSPALYKAIAATWAWTAALLANPWTWIVAGILLLGVVIVALATGKLPALGRAFEWLWKKVRGDAKKTADQVKQYFSPSYLLSHYNPVEMLQKYNPFRHMGIPGLAAGGTVINSGWSWVGEQGPELRYIPRGASVVPLQGQKFSMPTQSGPTTIRVPVYLDSRQIAEVVAERINDIEARG